MITQYMQYIFMDLNPNALRHLLNEHVDVYLRFKNKYKFTIFRELIHNCTLNYLLTISSNAVPLLKS